MGIGVGFAGLAQSWLEQRSYKPCVLGSNPRSRISRLYASLEYIR